MKDLVVLAADKNMEYAIQGLLARHEALGIRPTTSQVYVHPQRDPGCLKEGHRFLRSMVDQFAHALIMFDREGCGQDSSSSTDLEQQVQERLSQSGWDDRAAVIVLDPELEIWVWSDSPHVDEMLGWGKRQPRLRDKLVERGLLETDQAKPAQPKQAVEWALREARKARSSALYGQLAQRIGLGRCSDPAFVRFKRILRKWFARRP
jgi:hypothetical protein